jgi:hypothetical protein
MTNFEAMESEYERACERYHESEQDDDAGPVDYVERARVAREAANAASEWWRRPAGQARLAEIRQLAEARRAGTVAS